MGNMRITCGQLAVLGGVVVGWAGLPLSATSEPLRVEAATATPGAFVAHVVNGTVATLVPSSEGLGVIRIGCKGREARITYVLARRLPTSRVILEGARARSRTLQPGQSLTVAQPINARTQIVRLVVLPFSKGPSEMIHGWVAVSDSVGRAYRCDAGARIDSSLVGGS